MIMRPQTYPTSGLASWKTHISHTQGIHYLTYTSVKTCHWHDGDGIMGIWESSYGLSWLDLTIKLMGVASPLALQPPVLK